MSEIQNNNFNFVSVLAYIFIEKQKQQKNRFRIYSVEHNLIRTQTGSLDLDEA